MGADISELESRLEAVGTAPEEAQARVDALVDLASVLRFSQTERANRLAREARELSRSMGYQLGQARAARILGLTAGKFTRTLRDNAAFGEEAKALFDEVGDQAGSAASRDFLASILEYTGDLSSAMELALEALSLAREIDDPVRQGFALSNVGGILSASGDGAGASERLHEALGLFESVDHAQGIGRICERLSKMYRDQGDLDEALAYARRLRDAAERSVDSSDRATALATMGELEQEKGNRGEAERLFRASLEAYDTEETRAVMGMSARVRLGRLLTHRGAYAEAKYELTKALEGVIPLGEAAAAEEANARQVLADVSELQGDLREANAQLHEVIRLREGAAVQATVQRHGGRVEVESAPGQGTTFVFSLPARPQPDTIAPAAEGHASTVATR